MNYKIITKWETGKVETENHKTKKDALETYQIIVDYLDEFSNMGANITLLENGKIIRTAVV